jgi:DME family drug/metabolite transporter
MFNSKTGLLAIMLAAVFWGTGGAAAKFVGGLAPNANPQSIAFLRMALSVPALVALSALTLGPRMWRVDKGDALPTLLAGALVALYQVAYFAAIPRVGVAIATIVALCSAPVIVAVLSMVIARERPAPGVLVALACAIVGTILLVQVPANGQQNDVFGGVLLALLSGGLYAINTLVGRKLGSGGRAHPLQTATFGFAFGALLLLLIALASGLFLQYPTQGWLGLLYLGVFPTAVAYALFYAGMGKTPAAVASIATLMEPLTATILAVVVFNEPLSSRVALGGALLVAAMVILLVRQETTSP